jgi:hypothetical protein
VLASFHFLLPILLSTGKSIKIKTTRDIAMQVDGEPWIQPPSVIGISYASQVQMLCMDDSE